ncbi:unnamed protein product [Phytophthora fragariaefolia]|uniref:Unnamed protein product n=1 Tax=Phytophthora fragariaefolia TaxID=1490495 RepID=A0A9W6Y250_9STRA|nr:unnamed protein product [Phytophthora fragariaefolia]
MSRHDAVSTRCPAGTYGSSSRLSTPQCSGKCPVGHYCPKASARPAPCSAGTYGASEGLSDASCSGVCPVGYACPEGTGSATTWPCEQGTFCPAGSAKPRTPRRGTHVVDVRATEEVACPVGSFCSPDEAPGSSRLCPGGTFGNVTGLGSAACSGPCLAGYYCPRGSTSATQLTCGGVDVFCPTGSAFPTQVSPGHYTVGGVVLAKGSLTTDALEAEREKDKVTRVAQRPCEPGHYCVGGERFECPAGTYGSSTGLSTPECSGPCASGYYCPVGSAVATAVACDTSTAFCPQGSAVPTRTDRGYCAISVNSTTEARWYDQRKARPGEFASRGMCYPCPAGTYSSEEMESKPLCSGNCAAGYYCPPRSTSPTQRECGSASVFCPEASGQPTDVSEGYYTSLQVRAIIPNTTQAPGCEPGRYRDYSTTTNAFMDIVTGRSPISVDYGDYSYPVARCVACPTGTFKPVTGDDLELCQPCPEFTTVSTSDHRSCTCFRLSGGDSFDAMAFALYFVKATQTCELVPKTLLSFIGDGAASKESVYTRPEQFPCEKGYFCRAGVRSPCPAGYFGDSSLETRPTCAGVCSPGFYCPFASQNNTARVCGDANVFCPSGSAVPTPVWSGYYSVRLLPFQDSTNGRFENSSVKMLDDQVRSTEVVRDDQRICEPGSFCVDGKKYLCPAGYYGDKSGETSPLCAGFCTRGYYCPKGSASPTQRECGADRFVCPTGSPEPQLIRVGYYSVGVTNTTRFFQRPCEPGYFCVNGIKYQCPAGTYGETSGLSTAACSGKCAPGYYCPSYPNPPSISRTQNECGNSSVYCPEGTGNEPKFVLSGYYSILTSGLAGDGRNATQNGMKKCPKGFYCRQGIRIRCPEGTYGDMEGLSAVSCSGWCPAGYSCPFATTDYRLNPCLPGTYATKGAAVFGEDPAIVRAEDEDQADNNVDPGPVAADDYDDGEEEYEDDHEDVEPVDQEEEEAAVASPTPQEEDSVKSTPSATKQQRSIKPARTFIRNSAVFFRDEDTLREMRQELRQEKKTLTNQLHTLMMQLAEKEQVSAAIKSELQQLKTSAALANVMRQVPRSASLSGSSSGSINGLGKPKTAAQWGERVLDQKLENQCLAEDLLVLKTAVQDKQLSLGRKQKRRDEMSAKLARVPRRHLCTLVDVQVEIARLLEEKRALESQSSRCSSRVEKESTSSKNDTATKTALQSELMSLQITAQRYKEELRQWELRIDCEKARSAPLENRLASLRQELVQYENSQVLLRSVFLRLGPGSRDGCVALGAALTAFQTLAPLDQPAVSYEEMTAKLQESNILSLGGVSEQRISFTQFLQAFEYLFKL